MFLANERTTTVNVTPGLGSFFRSGISLAVAVMILTAAGFVREFAPGRQASASGSAPSNSVAVYGATPSPDDSGAQTSRQFSIGGIEITLTCQGIGNPTVIVLPAIDSQPNSWSSVSSAIGQEVRVCEVIRPSTPIDGEAEPPATPVGNLITAADLVAELNELLSAADEAGPFLLVGARANGLQAELFARTYPDQVAGVVFVNPFTPGFILAYEQTSPSIGTEVARNGLPSYFLGNNGQNLDMRTSAAQVLAAPAYPVIPTTVLYESLGGMSGMRPEYATLVEMQQEMAIRLGGTSLIVTGTGSEMEVDAPDQVIAAILELLSQVRTPE